MLTCGTFLYINKHDECMSTRSRIQETPAFSIVQQNCLSFISKALGDILLRIKNKYT